MNERFINTGLGFGALPHSEVIEYLLNNYMNLNFKLKSGIFNRVCSQIETEALEEYYPSFLRNDKTQKFNDGTVMISTSVWGTYSYHIGTGTWLDEDRDYTLIEKSKRHMKIKRAIRNPKYFLFVRKYFGRRAEYVYEFLTYDLLDMGVIYFAKRLINKIFRKLNSK